MLSCIRFFVFLLCNIINFIGMYISQVTDNKKQYLDLLLLADEQESLK